MIKPDELAILDKVSSINSTDVYSNFLKLYDYSENDESITNKLNLLFAYYHQQFNRLFEILNSRINGNKHYCANESRDLLYLIENIMNLQYVTERTPHYFTIIRPYFLHILDCQKFLCGSGGSTIPDTLRTIYIEKYKPIFELRASTSEFINPERNIEDVLSVVSTRSAVFAEMSQDEKLCCLNQAIEYMLKENQKYIQLNSKDLFCDFIKEEDIRRYRCMTHCFRHGEKNMVEERKAYTDEQKVFLTNYGLSICMRIAEFIKTRK